MADRYWVGGTGTWNASNTTNWSASPGGAGGASVPTAADNVFFDQTGTYTVTVSGTRNCLNLTVSAGIVGLNASGGIGGNITIYGSLSLIAATTVGNSTVTNINFRATTTGQTITTNGVVISACSFDGVGGSWILQDALTQASLRPLTHSNGTLDLNGKTLTVGRYLTSTGDKELKFNGGTLVCPGSTSVAFSNGAPTGFTTTAGTGTGTISMTGGSAKTFVGGGSTYNCTVNQGGAGTLTITGNNTFNNITNTVQPASILFTAGTTTTFNNFSLSGTAGNLITIASDTSATHTLSKASGTVSCNYLSITNSTATGGASWYAGANSTNVSGNTGWIFANAPAPVGNTGAFFSIL